MNTTSSELGELLGDFAAEAIASLRTLPTLLERFHRDPTASDLINAVFRAVHSVKGNASFFELTAIKTFAHSLEHTLDRIRNNQVRLTLDLLRDLIAAFDQLDEMVSVAATGTIETQESPRCRELLAAIARHAELAPEPVNKQPILLLLQALETLEIPGFDTPRDWLAEVARNHVQTVENRIVESQSLPETHASNNASQDITPYTLANANWIDASIDLAERTSILLELFQAFERNEYAPPVGDAFVARARELAEWAGREKRESLARALNDAANNFAAIADGPVEFDRSLLDMIWDSLWPELIQLVVPINSEATHNESPSKTTESRNSANKNGENHASENNGGRLVRVKEERLDEFLNYVSRLFITGEMLKDLHSRLVETGLLRPLVEELRQIIRSFSEQANGLQKGLFALRRVAVAGLFSKFPRMARSLAQQLGKQIDIQILGEEVELDKALLEDLDAPLTHILRNAVDHGIDSPESRQARGVNSTGCITLTAEVTRTHARVIIQDDGLGIDPRRLRSKAVEKGLFTEAETEAMSDHDAIQLIFHPGFSTAAKLSDISGRGVGLDVVRTSVRKHNGEVYVDSQVGVGTTFRLEVPLREAVIVVDGLVVRQNGQDFVIPFEQIREISQIRHRDLGAVQGSAVATIRNSIYDARRLATILNLPDLSRDSDSPLTAVLVGAHHQNYCLLVDEVRGNRKVVVNNISGLLPNVNKIAGVAQLGGGRLALVLSIPDLMKSVANERKLEA